MVKTYEWPAALDVVLRSLSEEQDQDFDLVVADDGSGPATADTVESWQGRVGTRVAHAWQPDAGFRLARSENLGALEADGDFLVFLDGDTIPRRGFVRAVRRAALPGWFLATKRLNLTASLSASVLEGKAPVWRWSSLRWLALHPRDLVAAPRAREPNRPGMILPLRDRRRPWRDEPEFAPPYEGYGCFLAIWRSDIERVNGFDTRFVGWGEEDVDMAVRLRRSGVRCGWAGPETTVLHLWHPDRTRRENMPLLHETQSSERVEAVEGLRELEHELAAAAQR